ncbi:nucleoside recognition domain-containing protein [Brachymonas sp. G13]|uniref:nucleoside recognition domain-containing protein n=1 Tax=Brachymonas wangyanguii TaxID=3130163 RepID=UPI00307FAFE1
MLIDIIMQAGRAGIEFSLFVMLPIMIVMLFLMRLMEAHGWLDWIVQKLTPVLRPFGLGGLGIFAALQVSLVSFAAPVATLSIMDQRGISQRQIAATLAMVFAMAQANASFPMMAMGLEIGVTLLLSVIGGLVAAAVTWHLIGRKLPDEEAPTPDGLNHATVSGGKGLLDVINAAGSEAFKIALGAIPIMVLALVVVGLLQRSGSIDWLTGVLTPLLTLLHIDPVLVLPTLTKYLAGGSAMLAVMSELHRAGQVDAALINLSAGWLLTPLDLAGIAVLISSGRRIAAVWKYAALGSLVGMVVRVVGHAVLL